MRKHVIGSGVGAALLIAVVGCATAPVNVWKMSSDEIQTLAEAPLCDALAVARKDGRPVPVVEAEASRRRITCAAAIERTVSDCRSLEILKIEGAPVQGATIFTVANRSARPKTFRIAYRGIQSSLLSIPAGATKGFGIAVDPRIGAVGTALALKQGGMGAMLNECLTAYGF